MRSNLQICPGRVPTVKKMPCTDICRQHLWSILLPSNRNPSNSASYSLVPTRPLCVSGKVVSAYTLSCFQHITVLYHLHNFQASIDKPELKAKPLHTKLLQPKPSRLHPNVQDKCIQCNVCSAICPHAVIRPFLLSHAELKKAPFLLVYRNL